MQVIASVDPKDGGPSYSVPRLSAALREAGCVTTIATIEPSGSSENLGMRVCKHDWALIPVFRALRVSGELKRALNSEANNVDVIHSHGLWLMPNVYAGLTAGRSGKPLIVSPRGMLAPVALNFSRWKKKFFWHTLQGRSYTYAAAWHATSVAEVDEIRAFGITTPIAMIPNGIDVSPIEADHSPEKRSRTLLFLSRIHPKKGLVALLSAWEHVSASRTDWQLLIAGPSEGNHQLELETMIRAKSIPSVRFAGAVYGAQKEQLLRNADLFVLPTLNENFGIAVAEALAAGIPAVVTTGAPWQDLANEGCGWWVEQGVEPLVSALLEATALTPGERQKMGRRGREWMGREFSWHSVASRMIRLYAWAGKGGERPPFLY